MRIAYLITRMDSIGGAQVHVRDMAMAMNAEGHEVCVLYGSEGPYCSELCANGVSIWPVKGLKRNLRPWNDLYALKELLRILSQIGPDILSLHSSKAGWLGRMAGRKLGIPTLFTAHGWSFSGGLSWHRTHVYLGLEKLASLLSDQIVTVCKEDRHLAIRYGLASDDRIMVVHNGVHELSPRILANPLSPVPRIIMVARFQEPKKHSTLLKALASLRELPWTLEFVGDGPLRAQTAMLAQHLGLGDRVLFSGACSDVSQRLAQAQLFVLLSAREGFPRSILEAMRSGLPVIASDVGGIREAVDQGKTGFIVSEGDKAALVSRLRLLLTDPELRIKMGQAGREAFLKSFTFEVMLEKTMKVYEKLRCGEGHFPTRRRSK